MMSTGAPTGPNDFISHHSQQQQQQQQQQSLQPFTNNGITNSGPANDPPVLSQGPTTSATIRNIYMSAASAAYNGTPDYTQNLSSTPTSSSLSSPGIAAVANTKNKPAVIGEDGPVIGSVPLVHHHKAASFIIPSTTTTYSDYNPSSQQQQTQQYASSQASSASSAALHQHRQQKVPLQQPQPQHQSQRSFSASASIWNSNPTPSSLRQNPVSMLASSFSNVQINNHQEFLEDHEFAIDDDDDGLEDFVPSSLTDLLTDKERQRRGSRPSSSAHPTLNSANPRMSFSNANTAIWASNSPRTFARRHLGDVDGLSLNGDSVVGYGSPLRSSFSLSSNNGTINSSFNGMALPPPIGTPEGGSSYMASYKSQILANNSHQQSKSSLVVGVGSSVLSDDGVTGILTPNDIDTKNNNEAFNENNVVTPTVAKSTLVPADKYVGTDERSKGNDGSSATSPSNELSEFDETQFEMDEDVPKVQSEFGLAR